MATIKRQNVYSLPEHWVAFLEYGERDGLSDSDIAGIESFLAAEELEGACFEYGNSIFFMRYHDARAYGVLSANCVEVTATVFE